MKSDRKGTDMTIEEAIDHAKEQTEIFSGTHGEFLDVAIAAMEKQIPKKPILYGDSEDGKLLCPNCNEDLWDIKECGFNGCPYCLQAIYLEEGGV